MWTNAARTSPLSQPTQKRRPVQPRDSALGEISGPWAVDPRSRDQVRLGVGPNPKSWQPCTFLYWCIPQAWFTVDRPTRGISPDGRTPVRGADVPSPPRRSYCSGRPFDASAATTSARLRSSREITASRRGSSRACSSLIALSTDSSRESRLFGLLHRENPQTSRGRARGRDCASSAPHSLSYSSWRCHQKPVSLRPSGARSSHWYMPQRPSIPRSYAE